MAYFQNKSPEKAHRRVFVQPLPEDDPFSEDDGEELDILAQPMSEEAFEAQEVFESHRDRMRVLGGVGDLLGVLIGTALILALVALIISLATWVINDMRHSFTLLDSWF